MRIVTASTSVALLVPVLLACSSSSNGSSGGGSGAPPICKAHSVEIDGTLDGANANGSYSGPNGYEFINGSQGTLVVNFGTSGVLNLAWSSLVPDDQSVAVTGTITMPSEGPHAGQVYCIESGSMIPRGSSEGNGVSFSFTSLAKGACPGTAVSGSLLGCASSG